MSKYEEYTLDKDGNDYKTNRKLAWERDNYKCQYPGCKTAANYRSLQCHHVIPYRISFSHHYSNLISLCRRHHKITEKRTRRLWGYYSADTTSTVCISCQKPGRKLNDQGVCRSCNKYFVLIPKAKLLNSKRYSLEEIARILDVSISTARSYLKEAK